MAWTGAQPSIAAAVLLHALLHMSLQCHGTLLSHSTIGSAKQVLTYQTTALRTDFQRPLHGSIRPKVSQQALRE